MEAAAPPPAAPPPAPTPKRVDVGRVISEAFSLYSQNAGVLLGSAAVIFVVTGVLQAILQDAGGLVLYALAQIVLFVATTLYTGMVVRLVEDLRDGRRDMSVGDLVSSVGEVLLPLIGNSILKGIAVVIGFILLIVPGLILLTIWAVTAPAIVVERAGAVESFGRSWELVKGEAWSVFGALVVAFLIVIGVGIVAGAIGIAIGLVGVIILSIIANILTAPVFALVSAILFFDLGGGQPIPAAPAAPAAPPPPAA